MSYKDEAKASSGSKLHRLTSGIPHRATGGKVMPDPMKRAAKKVEDVKAEGGKAKGNLAKKSRSMIHKHEKAKHPGEPLTALKHGGPAKKSVGGLIDLMGEKGIPMGGAIDVLKEKGMGGGALDKLKDKYSDKVHKIGGLGDELKKGGAVKRATGGAVKKPATNINIVIAPKDDVKPETAPGALAALPKNPIAPPMPPMPPAAGPAGPGPMMGMDGPPLPGGLPPMRKAGGRVKAESLKAGTKVTHTPGKNDLKDIRNYPPITKASGGKVTKHHMTGGAGSGEGRLDKIGK